SLKKCAPPGSTSNLSSMAASNTASPSRTITTRVAAHSTTNALHENPGLQCWVCSTTSSRNRPWNCGGAGLAPDQLARDNCAGPRASGRDDLFPGRLPCGMSVDGTFSSLQAGPDRWTAHALERDAFSSNLG